MRCTTKLLIGIPAIAAAVGGCAQRVQPIFDPQASAPAWPLAPHVARIRYVGQLASAEDLRPTRNALETLGAWIAGPPERQPFYGPRAILCTRDNRRLWIADPGGRCVHLLDLHDRTYRKITRAGNSPLLGPIDFCFGPGDTIYLCDSQSGDIHQFAAASGNYRRTLRLPTEIRRPVAIDYAPNAAELFVVDVVSHDIKVLDARDRIVRILGRRGSGPGEFNFPCDVALDDDSLWVVDTGNHRVQRIATDGTPLSAFGQAGHMPGDLAMPKSIAIDSDGHLHVVDSRFENLQVFDRDGRLLLIVGEEGVGPGEFWLPAGIFIDQGNRIWICDSYNGRVQVFDYTPDSAVAVPSDERMDQDAPRAPAPSNPGQIQEHES